MAHRVAVIDDEKSIREMLQIGLSQEGFEVRTAFDGPDGLTVVRDWKPDCIVLDIMMPKIDGLSLIPLLRRLTEVPIIMLTARGDVRDRIDRVIVAVRDRGPGIPEREQAHVFERFFRGRDVPDVEGTGLGLAIVERAAARAGGSVRLQSGSGTGTTFTIALPSYAANGSGAHELRVG